VFWIIAFLVVVAAVAYEALQALNRFAALTRDDIPTRERRSHEQPRTNLTSPLLL
jgi:hypothetical protein